MPGSPILAAHVAEIIRKKNAKEAAAKKANAKTATQKASSKAVTDIVNQGIKEAGGGKGSTLSSIKPSKGILASQYNPLSALSPVLARRIAERKAVAQRNQGRYAMTHGTAKQPESTKLKTTPNGVMQQHNQRQVENYGTAKSFVDNIGLMKDSLLHGAGPGTLNSFIEGSHYLDSLYKMGDGDKAGSGNIHKTVIAANQRNNEANNVGNPLDAFQDKYQKDTEKLLAETEKEGLEKTAGFMMGLGQSAATLPAFAIPGLGEAVVYFQTAGQRYDEAIRRALLKKMRSIRLLDALPPL